MDRRAKFERWTNPSGWSIDLPVGWQVDRHEHREGFVPPSAVGRLSIIGTLALGIPGPLDEGHVLDLARSLAASTGIPFRDPPVLRLGPGHMAVEIRGKARGRHSVGLIHAFADGTAVLIAWHTPDPRDPDEAAGIEAARSVRPMRSLE